MIKYGFECEYFCFRKGVPVLIPSPGLPHDECGYLAECRGEPHTDPLKAAYLFLAEEEKLHTQARGYKVTLRKLPYLQLSKEFERQALRTFGKPRVTGERGNMYGKDYDPSSTIARAGLHIHFSNTVVVKERDRTIQEVPGILDMPRIIRTLDKRFAKEIEAAQRVPGFYEMKAHGFEYRSLPANIDAPRVGQVLADLHL